MMKNVSLRKSKTILFLFFFILNSAQYKVIAKVDLNLDKINDNVYKDSISNNFIFEYGKLNHKKKNDSIFFFSNYNKEAGSVNFKIIKNIITVKFTYAPKYLDHDLLTFTYDKQKKDWFLSNLLSYRTDALSERLMTEKCHYKVPKKLDFSLKKNRFDDIQEKIIDNRKYLSKCSKNYFE